MKKISRRSFLAVCGAMAATAALTACGGSSASTAGTAASGSTAGSAASGEVFELKLSTTQTDTSMIYQGLQAAADKVAEDTDGHVKVTIYPSSQLGGEEDMIDQALQGMGIAVLTDAGRLSSYVNDIGIMNMAYIVDNYEDGMKLMATDTFKGWDADLAKRITDVAGASSVFHQGVVTYANEAKTRLLGVPEELLASVGAVSPEVARCMAEQACTRYGSTWGVGISGIAGPGGATATKPVGLVYIALSNGRQTWLRVMRPHGRYMGRAWTRQRAASHALDMLRRAMLGLPVEMEA